MSELHSRLRELLAALSASDPSRKRFGARHHRYELVPALTDAELDRLSAGLGAALPDDYLDYVGRFSAGGVGPYYGLLRPDRAAAFVVAAPAGLTAWRRALPIAHLGCGYAATLPLDGPAAGQVWIDARGIGMVEPIRASFTAFVLDWIDRLAHNAWLEGFVPVGRCALQAALSGYLHHCEQQLGLGEGELSGPALREALGRLGAGAIAIAADPPLFDEGDPVDPCITCARMLENLSANGLAADVVAPGLPARPARANATGGR